MPLDLTALGVAYATGNGHKWLCAPKGSAFLYVREDKRNAKEGFRPLVLSNTAFGDLHAAARKLDRSVFHIEFDYCGTFDPTPLLTIPDAIETLAGLHSDGLPGVMAANRALVLEGRQIICEAIGAGASVPASMVGPIATLTLPPHSEAQHAKLMTRPSLNHDALWKTLQENWGIQVPVWNVPTLPGAPGTHLRRTIRLSAQLYNSRAQYEYLAEALRTELVRERDF